jgi:D-aminopeptidase
MKRIAAQSMYPCGALNAITDVAGVCVGHMTLIEGDDIRTGTTAILPHNGNLYQDRAPAGIVVANGFGKLMGYTQVRELGEIETPILLTNTLCVPRAADAILDWTLSQAGNEDVRSVNPVVGETNDGTLNNIRQRALTVQHHLDAINGARGDAVQQGCVGAGTGTMAFGYKGGIGSSSRVLPSEHGGFTVGALVQSNFGGVLQVLGHRPIARAADRASGDGSIMIVIATDAPLSDRNLTRLARRAFAGLARTGASFSNGSGDYAIAFSVAESVRRTSQRRATRYAYEELPNDQMSPLFQAVIEATEEAIYNSLFYAHDMHGHGGTFARALTLDLFPDLA